MSERIVIAGASHGGVSLADWLRRTGFAGEVVLVSAEDRLPYQRPPLSKAPDLLTAPAEKFAIRKPEFYTDRNIELRGGCTLTAIDRAGQAATLSTGETLSYSHLVLATGARARRLPERIVEGTPPLSIRSFDDAAALRSRLVATHSLTVIGGGLIGLEIAALAARLGVAVTVIEAAPRLLARVAPPAIADRVCDFHRRNGITIRLGEGVARVSGTPEGYAVTLDTGEVLNSDLAIAAVGSAPRVELAVAAGLAVENGILVSPHGQTSDARIWAVGDCCNWALSGAPGGRLRFEGMQPAMEQARIAAHAITGTDAAPFAVPRFWSDQGELRLQVAGWAPAGVTYVSRRGEDEGCSVLALAEGRAVACYALNAPDDFRNAVRLIEISAQPPQEAEFELLVMP